MAFEFRFYIDPQKIIVQDTQTGYRLEVCNRAAYRLRDGLMLSLGEAENVARKRLSGFYEREAGKIRSVVLFGADGAELPYEVRAIEYYTRLLHQQSQQARPLAHFATKLVDGFDYILEIPGYEAFSDARRQALEQRLQASLRLRRLVINGQAVQIPAWKKILEFWLRRILTFFYPIAALAIAYLTMPAALKTSPPPFLAYLLFIIYFAYYTGKILWMLLARRLVPRDYRLCMLQGLRSNISRIDRFLAKLLWGYPQVT